TRAGRQGLRGEALRAGDRVGVGLVGLAAERREASVWSSRSASGTGDRNDARVAVVGRASPELAYTSGLAGRNVSPMRYASTPRAASRPSRIAHTTSDCPRRASPHANTPGTVVW